MTTHPPLISVIILNWNGKDLLSPCLRSVKEQTYPSLEIILVDNASTDGSVEFIQSLYPDFRLVRNSENLGYGGGNNRGIREARGIFLFLLNSDTEIEKDCLERLHGGMEGDPRIGVTTPKILFYSRRNIIDAAGLTIYPDGLSTGRGRSEEANAYDRREEVFFGSGCASLYRKAMFEDIGLLDEDFFAYAEDTDLGWRASLAGWKAHYIPEAVVYHHHSGTFGADSSRKAFLVERNRVWVAWKSFPVSLLFMSPFYALTRYFYQGIAALTGKGAAGSFGRASSPLLLLPILLKALFSAAVGLPAVIRKRREIRSRKRISNSEFYRLLRKYAITARKIAFLE